MCVCVVFFVGGDLFSKVEAQPMLERGLPTTYAPLSSSSCRFCGFSQCQVVFFYRVV